MTPQEKIIAKSITPRQFRSYLIQQGWIEEGSIKDLATIWHRSESDEFEVILPESEGIRDYIERIADAIESLSEYEKRDEALVLKDVANYFADLISVRVVHTDVENGTIPLEDGVRLFERTKELVASATMASFSRKRFFVGAKSNEVSNFLSKVRLGQTEIGSYIVNVVAPLDVRPEQENIDRTSLARVVTNTLGTGLSSLKRLSNQRLENDEFLQNIVDDGVSANLCDSIVGISGEDRKRGIEVSISYSFSEEIAENPNVVYSFSSEDIPLIEKASELLKENYVLKGVTVSGLVKKLDRDENDDVGTVTVVAFLEDRERAVSFELSPEQYHEAIQAHDKKKYVEIRGDVHVSPRSAKLVNGKGFKVFGSGDLFD